MSYTEFEDMEDFESKGVSFDIKGFLFKVLSLWKLLVLCVGIGFGIAYLVNVRKQNVYRLDSLVSIENDQNPFFTANTSISFNWGGVSGKVGQVITSLKTRTHNEIVVDSLAYYIEYLKEGRYRKADIYKNAPFYVELDKTKGQVLGQFIGIRFLSETDFEVFTEFESETGTAQLYGDKSKTRVKLPLGEFKKTFTIDEPIHLPFLNLTVRQRDLKQIKPNTEFYLRFHNFDSKVRQYQNSINIKPHSDANSSVLNVSLAGFNKMKIVDYINTTTAILSLLELERKNLYATNTIKFIDSSIAAVNTDLKDVNDEMNRFRKENKVFDVSVEMDQISSRLREFELQKEAEQTKIDYLEALDEYLRTKTNYVDIAAPTSVGIDESNVLNSVSKITALAIERQNLEYTTREGSELFKELDRRINAEKNVLLATINATNKTIRMQMNTLSRNIAGLEGQLSELPEEQQAYLRIARKLSISQEAYNVYMAKRSEAAIVKAANISDITVIDAAKDIGGGMIGPNKSLNYIMAIMFGIAIPLVLIFIVFILDDAIHGQEEVERLSNIPILGVVGKNHNSNNLVVHEKPKSAVAESFRAIRSSLEFIYKRQKKEGARTIMFTSSISGEGKTFCSMNIATAYAMTGKKTILLGLDLRKPKIFGDFDIENDIGVVNYLIGDRTLEEVTKQTHIENLDVITSGPIPPNPSELLIGDELRDMIATLRENYDMIVLDTPPLGLVSDALDLIQYADASLFVLRLDYTKKGMLKLINAKHKAGEVHNISFLLNFFDHKSNQSYGYNYGYGYGYGAYGDAYHEKDAAVGLFGKIKKRLKNIKKS